MSAFAILNGALLPEADITLSVNNRSFRYGDGFFETIKVSNGKVLLSHLHFTRLFAALEALYFEPDINFTKENLLNQIRRLVETNGHTHLARVRLTIFRTESPVSHITDFAPRYLIQSWPGDPQTLLFNERGLTISVFPEGRKTIDSYANIKSNNYLLYALGSIWAAKNGLDDCLVLNTDKQVADATIANVFIYHGGIVKTPPLRSGCVAGVMRRYLLDRFKKEGLTTMELPLNLKDVQMAEEVFFTNANYGLRWVAKMDDKVFNNSFCTALHQRFIAPLFGS